MTIPGKSTQFHKKEERKERILKSERSRKEKFNEEEQSVYRTRYLRISQVAKGKSDCDPNQKRQPTSKQTHNMRVQRGTKRKEEKKRGKLSK
ncbi:hypothetical protein M440DRAFT_1274715 [Trichoderma longibrachiatum ATCC 18648]|uniref:Uncharacterized protein n=1 Tax=Trichoderma longibrachiatum ATCC 18648 TaxID=983965 RepID=A0A2T4C1J2_TRILO|nr:hypothetical protein M440DRAFT_1274715 [Trichoderma longibrachiatum ATCC 18648]